MEPSTRSSRGRRTLQATRPTPRRTTVTLDKTAPTTSDDAPAGSRSSDVTITLSPDDGTGSGVASTSYRTDGGGWVGDDAGVLVPAPADHSNDGVHTIDYASVDNVGNTEAVSADERHDRHPVAERHAVRPGLAACRDCRPLRPLAERRGRGRRLGRLPVLAARSQRLGRRSALRCPRRGRSPSIRRLSPMVSTTSVS